MATWRSTDRYNLALLFDLPITEDRVNSCLDHDMTAIVDYDALNSTQYVTVAQGLIDECLTLRDALPDSLDDVGVRRIDIDRQIAVTQDPSAAYAQADAKYKRKLAELLRIFGYAPPGNRTIRS